ncbi:unnamed protein product [Cyprideis torosa]|uniref:Uncharacterized protein n=1 Tax=Cyprideis torosa TaxID=163714 RepID=A0A7R8ZP48_9CRUS|nr:unnamed protein product [Cyprideis torosa]CAG0899596.1 unnamed protein product [Cyprideis torosa]
MPSRLGSSLWSHPEGMCCGRITTPPVLQDDTRTRDMGYDHFNESRDMGLVTMGFASGFPSGGDEQPAFPETADLSHNQIVKVSGDAFRGLSKLNSL